MPPKSPPPIPPDAHGRWEYKVIAMDHKFVANVEQVLNGLGEQGWEMVSMVPESGKTTMAFKRRKRA